MWATDKFRFSTQKMINIIYGSNCKYIQVN